MTTRKRVRPGDVLELKAGSRFGYLHYLGKHPMYGDAVMVSPQMQEHRARVTSETFSNGYVTFYPASAAVAQELVKVVAQLPPPDLPKRFRRAGAVSGRGVETWIIEDDSEEIVKAQLSEEELRLPIASIWNHEYLVARIAEGWLPVHEGRGGSGEDVPFYPELLESTAKIAHEDRDLEDARAISEIAAVSQANARHVIRHYLYVPSRKVARTVAEELKQRGFHTEERPVPDGENWLLLASHEAVLTTALIASLRGSLETLMGSLGGEYDGWEAAVAGDQSAPNSRDA